MANFDWRTIPDPDNLLRRYTEDALGYREWQDLMVMLLEHLGANQPDPFHEGFNEFLRRLQKLELGHTVCRVFVSHQRKDVRHAERIAYLAHREGFEYWLDVHDPVLQIVNRAALPSVVQSFLIAAIIEMALLNCSHGITVQTQAAQQSRWVPYEFGRAKQRWVVSTQVASWFDNQVYVSLTADYLKLGVCAQSEREVENWLKAEFGRCICRPTQQPWGGSSVPDPLPI